MTAGCSISFVICIAGISVGARIGDRAAVAIHSARGYFPFLFVFLNLNLKESVRSQL